MKLRVLLVALVLFLGACNKAPVLAPQPERPTPAVAAPAGSPAPDELDIEPSPLPGNKDRPRATSSPAAAAPSAAPILAGPEAPSMTAKGLALIVEWEGYAVFPEAPDARFSGVSTALGYDWSTVAPSLSVVDWAALPSDHAKRLAATHKFTGRAAQAHLHEVKDIKSPREIGFAVFNKIDVPRFFKLCEKSFPGFEELAPPARDAILSLVYNRGSSLVGPNRSDMRDLVPLIKRKDYAGIASCLRRMKRVWAGTSIEAGMRNRREAEARLVESSR